MLAKRNSTLYFVQRALFYLLVVVIAFYLLFPFVWAVLTSFRRGGDLFLTPDKFLIAPSTIANYVTVFNNPDFRHAFLLSLVVGVGAVALSLLIGSFAAYALGRFRFRGKSMILYIILAVSVFPQIAVLGGLFTMIRQAGAYNNPLALIFSYLIFTIPFTVWVLTSFVRDIPGELEEAALVDGASPLQTLFQVLFPVMMPALVTTGLLAFINSWNEYLFALTFTSSNPTVPPVIATFSGASHFDQPCGPIMAASIVLTVPLIVMVLV
ncbi:MAG: carbohydrate ABC transporter permease, partial [Deinococcus sp.]